MKTPEAPNLPTPCRRNLSFDAEPSRQSTFSRPAIRRLCQPNLISAICPLHSSNPCCTAVFRSVPRNEIFSNLSRIAAVFAESTFRTRGALISAVPPAQKNIRSVTETDSTSFHQKTPEIPHIPLNSTYAVPRNPIFTFSLLPCVRFEPPKCLKAQQAPSLFHPASNVSICNGQLRPPKLDRSEAQLLASSIPFQHAHISLVPVASLTSPSQRPGLQKNTSVYLKTQARLFASISDCSKLDGETGIAFLRNRSCYDPV